MLVGHYAIALALKKVEPRLNVGWTFLVVMIPDMLLGLFVLMGLEKIIVPENYSDLHYLYYDFPLSHGLLATLILSGIAYIFVRLVLRGKENANRIALMMVVAILSHFILDLIVHVKEMPLLGAGSVEIGLGLGDNLMLALGLEVLLVIGGSILYLRAKPDHRYRAKIGMPLFMGFLTAYTVGGQLFSPAPPDTTGPALSWIMLGIIFALVALWIDKSKKEENG